MIPMQLNISIGSINTSVNLEMMDFYLFLLNNVHHSFTICTNILNKIKENKTQSKSSKSPVSQSYGCSLRQPRAIQTSLTHGGKAQQRVLRPSFTAAGSNSRVTSFFFFNNNMKLSCSVSLFLWWVLKNIMMDDLFLIFTTLSPVMRRCGEIVLC